MSAITPIDIDFPTSDVEDMRARVRATRWPDQVANAGWEYGAERSYLQDLANYWAHDFDWWAAQDRLNRAPQYAVATSAGRLHFVHQRAASPASALPIVLVHGWPGAYVQMLPLRSQLGEFDLVIPSLPGFPLSERPERPGVGVPAMAAAVHEVMRALGYDRYLVHGTDLGTLVAYEMAHAHPESVAAVHVSAAVMPFILATPHDLTDEETAFVERARLWMLTEMGYALQHGTKPQTVAYALNDSPVALAAWLVEKLRGWSDCHGDLDAALGRDDVLTLLSLYWLTQTGGSAIRIYYESVRDSGGRGAPKPNAPVIGPFTPSWSDVPVSVLAAPADMVPMPRRWAERMVRVERWAELDRGGHFAEWEAPELVAADIRAFARAAATE